MQRLALRAAIGTTLLGRRGGRGGFCCLLPSARPAGLNAGLGLAETDPLCLPPSHLPDDLFLHCWPPFASAEDEDDSRIRTRCRMTATLAVMCSTPTRMFGAELAISFARASSHSLPLFLPPGCVSVTSLLRRAATCSFKEQRYEQCQPTSRIVPSTMTCRPQHAAYSRQISAIVPASRCVLSPYSRGDFRHSSFASGSIARITSKSTITTSRSGIRPFLHRYSKHNVLPAVKWVCMGVGGVMRGGQPGLGWTFALTYSNWPCCEQDPRPVKRTSVPAHSSLAHAQDYLVL